MVSEDSIAVVVLVGNTCLLRVCATALVDGTMHEFR